MILGERRPPNTRCTSTTDTFFPSSSILPISDPATRRLEGWVSIAQLKKEAGETGIEESQLKDLGSKGGAVTRFVRSRKYKVITPATSLEELDTFLTGANVSFALVTDSGEQSFLF